MVREAPEAAGRGHPRALWRPLTQLQLRALFPKPGCGQTHTEFQPLHIVGIAMLL